MIRESKGLYNLIHQTLDTDLNQEDSRLVRKIFQFSGFLKNDGQGNYCLINLDAEMNDCSVKCIFNEIGLKAYLDNFEKSEPVTYESFNNCLIILKKYRFDYLLVFENNLISHRVACYIEEFEIDFDFKAKFEGIAKNINFDPTIVRKILKVSNNYMRKLVNDNVINKQPLIFEAKNFINKNYQVAENSTLPSISNCLDILKDIKNASNNNFLLKTEISIDDPWPFIQDVEVDDLVVSKVKIFDYFTSVYPFHPSVIEKEKGNEFKVSMFEVKRKDYSLSLDEDDKNKIYHFLNPSNLQLDIIDNEVNRKQYLRRKIKRHRPSKVEENLPESIKNLIKNYGDITANFTHNFYEKYCYFRKFKEYVKDLEHAGL